MTTRIRPVLLSHLDNVTEGPSPVTLGLRKGADELARYL